MVKVEKGKFFQRGKVNGRRSEGCYIFKCKQLGSI
jgi:hypothetical protein